MHLQLICIKHTIPLNLKKIGNEKDSKHQLWGAGI